MFIRLRVAGVLAALVLFGQLFGSVPGYARQETSGADARVRIIHGISDSGPIDLYVDGSLALFGIAFPEASTELMLPSGERKVAIVPSGASPEAAIAAGTLSLEANEQAYVTVVGTVADASVGLFAVDVEPLSEGQSRFRIINGLPDAGDIVAAFAGGEAISAPLAFGDASEYAAIEAGIYDMDILDAASAAPLLTLPQLELGAGVATDIVIVGQAVDATLQAVIAEIELAMARPTGSSARIVAGRCVEAGENAFDLGLVQQGPGEAVGTQDGPAMAQGFGLAPIAFDVVITEPHAVEVTGEDGESAETVACGDVGGRLTETGALVIALRPVAPGGPTGVAVLAPSLEDPAATGVSVFLETSSVSTTDDSDGESG